MLMFEFSTKTKFISEEVIKKILKLHEQSIKGYAYTIHDKDFFVKEDIENWEEKCKKQPQYTDEHSCPIIGAPKEPHWHVMVHLNADFKYGDVAKWFDTDVQYINKIKAPRFEGALPYLIHANRPEKYQYPISVIRTNIKNIEDIIGKEINKKTKAEIEAEEKRRGDEIYDKITSGEWKPYELRNHISADDYKKYSRIVKLANEYRSSILLSNDKISKCSVIWVYGKAGVGKTTLAEHICQLSGKPYCVSASGKDPLGNYRGEQILLLDDIDDVNFTIKELLKMIDSDHKKGAVKSRYYNKNIENVELFVITASCSPIEYYNNLCKCNITGEVEQLLRRLNGGVIHVKEDNNCEITYYDGRGKLENNKTKTSPLPQAVLLKMEEKRRLSEQRKLEDTELLSMVFGD